jgi:hypothetical protein
MALVAVAITAVVVMAGLSIDLGTLYQASAEAQRAADAGALAAARTIAMSGLTGDPTNSAGTWASICGGAGSPANLAAQAAAMQNPVGGNSNWTPTVTYSAPGGGSSGDCSGLSGSNFGINALVTVSVQQPTLPTFFSRVFGETGSSVKATATAEAFNSSNSGSYATWPRCVKPLFVPNYNPTYHARGGVCTGAGCRCTTNSAVPCPPFVQTSTGTINNPGIWVDNDGVIGETFWLVPDCSLTNPASCTANRPTAAANPTPNFGGDNDYPWGMPNLEYVPGHVSSSASASTAIPACTNSPLADTFAQAIAGCDQSTQYQCGVTNANQVDLSENPMLPLDTGDTTDAVQCLTNQTAGSVGYGNGQDYLSPFGAPPFNYPFQIQPGGGNLLVSEGLAGGSTISNSTSIVTLPIYDSSTVTQLNPTTTQVTVIGFLQVFINTVDGNGNVNVTIMNVVGCAPSPTTPTYNGSPPTSPVPVRLITPP